LSENFTEIVGNAGNCDECQSGITENLLKSRAFHESNSPPEPAPALNILFENSHTTTFIDKFHMIQQIN
jgi:hypothetical protein